MPIDAPMSLAIKVEAGPLGFGPYRKRQTFLERLWAETDRQMDQWITEGKIPAEQPGFIDYRMRLRRAITLHHILKHRDPDPLRQALLALRDLYNPKQQI